MSSWLQNPQRQKRIFLKKDPPPDIKYEPDMPFEYVTHNELIHLPKVSIVMTAFNRREQLLYTLMTISKSEYKNIEVIIVDDCSRDDEKITKEIIENSKYGELLSSLDIKIISITESQKNWVNPCVAYNIGLKECSGDIVIIQNSEVCHIGDCISLVVKYLKRNSWLTLNCYGLGNFNHNSILHQLAYDQKNIYDFMTSHYNINKVAGNSLANEIFGWNNHYKLHYTAYHYFGAIYREDLIKKLNGGFDDDYRNGLCHDDDDFVKRLIFHKFTFIMTEFNREMPFVIHQFHEKAPQMNNGHHLWTINSQIFKIKMKKLNMSDTTDIHQDKRPKPLLIKEI